MVKPGAASAPVMARAGWYRDAVDEKRAETLADGDSVAAGGEPQDRGGGCDFMRNGGKGRRWPRFEQACWMRMFLAFGAAQRWANRRLLDANRRRWRA